MKNIFCILLVCISANVFAQTPNLQWGKKVWATEKFQLRNITVTNISTDTTDANRSDEKLITEKAVKDFVDKKIPRNTVGYLIKMTTGPNGVPKINVDSSKLDSVIRSIDGGAVGLQQVTEVNATTNRGITVATGSTASAYSAQNSTLPYNYFIAGTELINGNHKPYLFLSSFNTNLSTQFKVQRHYIEPIVNDSAATDNNHIIRHTLPAASGTFVKFVNGVAPNRWGDVRLNLSSGVSIRNIFNEETTSTGSTTLTFANQYISNTIRLYRNGVRLSRSLWTETTSTTITLTFTPNAGDKFLSDYNY